MRRRSRQRGRKNLTSAKMDFSSMVDVVFLLLIFFITTLSVPDTLAKLTASAPTPPPVKEVDPLHLFKIIVSNESYVLDGRNLTEKSLRSTLLELGKTLEKCDIIIICDLEARHSRLVTVMDMCAEAKLNKLSLFSQ